MKSMSEPEFELLFNPRSIALIGASNNIGKWGAIVFLNIVLGGYRGKLYPVNPREETVLGHKAYSKITQIPEPVDLAIIAIPAHLTMEAVRDCIRKGIRMAIVITSDFSETGEEGARLERELTETARSAGLRLVGPNTMGIFSASADLTALMPPVRPRKGNVSLVSQSGNIGTQMLAWGEKFGVGFRQIREQRERRGSSLGGLSRLSWGKTRRPRSFSSTLKAWMTEGNSSRLPGRLRAGNR